MLNKSANPVVKEDEYKRCKELLEFVGEDARKPLSTGMMFLVLLMVFIDAAMISIVAMDYVADLPRKYALWGGVGVGFIVAIMLFLFTHEAGKALYRDTKRKELLDEINLDEMHQIKRRSGSKKISLSNQVSLGLNVLKL